MSNTKVLAVVSGGIKYQEGGVGCRLAGYIADCTTAKVTTHYHLVKGLGRTLDALDSLDIKVGDEVLASATCKATLTEVVVTVKVKGIEVTPFTVVYDHPTEAKKFEKAMAKANRDRWATHRDIILGVLDLALASMGRKRQEGVGAVTALKETIKVQEAKIDALTAEIAKMKAERKDKLAARRSATR